MYSPMVQIEASTRADKSEEDNTIKPATPQPPRSTAPPPTGIIGISASFIICMLTLLLMPLAGLHFCVGLDFVTPPRCNLF
jgi:hypothetical protein